MRYISTVAITAAVLLALSGACAGQDSTTAQPQGTVAAAARADSVAMVVFNGIKLFEVASVGAASAVERAGIIAGRIKYIASSYRHRPDQLRIVRDARVEATLIMSRDESILTTWDFEAGILGVEQDSLVEQRLAAISKAVKRHRSERSMLSLLKDSGLAILAAVLFVLAIRLIIRIRHRVLGLLERKLAGKTLIKVFSGESIVVFLKGVDRLLYLVVFIWLLFITLNFVLAMFPWTRGFAYRIFDLAMIPLKNSGRAFVSYIPNMIFIAVVAAGTVYLLRVVRYFFDEIGKGTITIKGFYPDWATPTFNIFRLLLIVFAFIVVFPYIPGSDSTAFKGVSLFLGVLVSLGSSSAMANIVSGIILIYVRPFTVGDRVRIGDTIGDVIERRLLRTRLLTPKNERVTIPNSQVLSGQIINYTSKAAIKDLILHTTVTIGYDVPWRDVHRMLLDAAKATENVLEEPEPFVLQKSLQDFYVEYELNAYTKKPRRIPETYSQLHENIQDQFEKAGVEILSPHYRMQRRDKDYS